MYKFKDESMKVPVYIWSKKGSIEESAIDQIRNASSLPFTFHHTVLCPDGHKGYGAPIGGILASKDYIVPNFVGLDIGCGMCAVKTSLTEIDTDTVKKIMGEIRKAVPVGFAHHKSKQEEKLMPEMTDIAQKTGSDLKITMREFDNAKTQVGTLGGGNHFIEIQKGSDGHIWVMIHSGSRNIGLQVANYYNRLAIELNDKWRTGIPKEWELAFLPIDSDEGHQYLGEMQYCVNFALANRKLMMDRVCEIVKGLEGLNPNLINITFDPMINIAHNYAALENHFGKNVWIHRKGATQAYEGQIGIIPGSQGTNSYIVKGKGNKESFQSCSHGAGRKMGRKEAQRSLSLEEEKRKMEGIVHGIRSVKDLDEAPGSYKDIDIVMKNQEDLISVEVKLTPLGVIKG
jgi:tRNA-splicing ligase RtcB